MAVKQSGKYYAGVVIGPHTGGKRQLMDELTDIRPSDVRMDCKYCYTDDAETVESHEYLIGHNMQLLCRECGAGLTPADPVRE